jgi:hypothetical protein
MLKQFGVGAALMALLASGSAMAGQGADLLREHLYAGTLSEGLDALGPMAEGGDGEAQFGAGVLLFMTGMENFAQSLYRYGLVAPQTGAFGPALPVPIPPNSNPEPIDYDKLRGVLEQFVADMDGASSSLQFAAEGGDYVVEIDPMLIRIDIDGDGTGSENERLGNIFNLLAGELPTVPDQDPELAPGDPPRKDKSGNGNSGTNAGPVEPPASPTLLGLDRADAIWLAGYSEVFAAQGDYILAHDFSQTVNAVFHRLFPSGDLPLADSTATGTLVIDPETDTAIADLIALIHTLNWPLTDTERLAKVQARLLNITALSRANWDAIEAETDDHLEYIPNPRQTPRVPDGAVTEEMVVAWRKALDLFDQVLKGELLIPHWRFAQGFDLNRYFQTATRTDFVMLMTGLDALPYLTDGPIASAEMFADVNAAFGGNLFLYAIWFN